MIGLAARLLVSDLCLLFGPQPGLAAIRSPQDYQHLPFCCKIWKRASEAGLCSGSEVWVPLKCVPFQAPGSVGQTEALVGQLLPGGAAARGATEVTEVPGLQQGRITAAVGTSLPWQPLASP